MSLDLASSSHQSESPITKKIIIFSCHVFFSYIIFFCFNVIQKNFVKIIIILSMYYEKWSNDLPSPCLTHFLWFIFQASWKIGNISKDDIYSCFKNRRGIFTYRFFREDWFLVHRFRKYNTFSFADKVSVYYITQDTC